MKLDKEIKGGTVSKWQDLTDLEGQYQVNVEIKNLQTNDKRSKIKRIKIKEDFRL